MYYVDDNSSEEEILILAMLLDGEEQQKRKRQCRLWVHDIFKKRLRFGEFHTLFPDLSNDEEKFFQYFRMSNEKFQVLLDIVKRNIKRENTTFRQAIQPEERLAVCLRFLATGNSFRSLAFTFRLGEESIREVVYSTCKAIWDCLQPIVMPSPVEDTWISCEKDFFNRWNFPNLIGAIDGKHVMIRAPPHSGSNYFCYKKYFSVVLLALVDAHCRFIAVDVGGFGRNSDGGIFANSNLGKAFKAQTLHVSPNKALPGSEHTILPHVIIGDEAFPLSTYLMRPYSGKQVKVDEEKNIYNYRLSRARNASENSFGLLVQKFRLFERRLNISPEHVNLVVLACCCLHNFLRNDTCCWTDADRNISISDMKGLTSLKGIGGGSAKSSMDIRDKFKTYFNTVARSVPWQLNKVREGRIFT